MSSLLHEARIIQAGAISREQVLGRRPQAHPHRGIEEPLLHLGETAADVVIAEMKLARRFVGWLKREPETLPPPLQPPDFTGGEAGVGFNIHGETIFS